jgi:hypothetical protein
MGWWYGAVVRGGVGWVGANQTGHLCAGIRPHGVVVRGGGTGWCGVGRGESNGAFMHRYSPTWGGGITLPVFAPGCHATIRPMDVHLWYKKNNNRNNDKFILME